MIKIRKAGIKELPTMISWAERKKDRNALDTSVFTYPATSSLCAYDDKKVVIYLPVQTCSMLESSCINPETTGPELAEAWKHLLQIVHWDSLQSGKGEIYFLGSDEATNRFAEHYGFEKVEMPVYRLRVKA